MKKYEAMVLEDPHDSKLRWLRVTHNGVSYSTIRLDSDGEILQIIHALQQVVQRTATPHEHLQADFDYICAGCGDFVKRRQ